MLFAIAISSLSLAPAASAKTQKNAITKAYIQYAKKMQKKSKKTLYYAIVNASKNGNPVLLISNDIIRGDTHQAAEKGSAVGARIYSYSKGKVIYISKMTSTGSSYPLIRKGKYIVSGWHHASQRLLVSGKKGTLEEVSGFGLYMEKGYDDCHKKEWSVSKGKKKLLSSKKISTKKATSLDYYHGGKIITFQPIQN